MHARVIDKTNIVETVERRLDSMDLGESLEIRTYKRNRAVLFTKLSGDRLRVVQDGFEQRTFDIPASRLRKAMKTLLKKEFPRSRKVRLYELGRADAGLPERKKL
jgi:hypothetical protein